MKNTYRFFSLLFAVALVAFPQSLTSPKQHYGFNIGDDYMLTTYRQTEAYFKKLAAESDRLKLVDIGKTEEGRSQYMMVISSPDNIRNLNRYQEISRKMGRAQVTEEEARQLSLQGKAVVWIDGGLHSTETVGTHQLIETIWQFASGNDPETLRILNDVIILCVHANPDGHDLISEWYMREPVPEKRVMTGAPRLYHKYIGHDNNRDFYMAAMKESTNINRQLFIEWIPQIMYNHHQSGPPGTVIFAPPFRGPFNYVFDPLVITSLDAVGAAMHSRFVAEDKPGSTMRGGANYSTWYNGGLRTTTYFHNMIGLLTEIIGSPTPMNIPFNPSLQLASGDLPAPITPQKWHYKQSIDYSLTANRAVLDYASRHREQLLFNIWKMGKNAIKRGSEDTWTIYPRRIDAVKKQIEKDGGNLRSADLKYYELLKKPELRDARGYILSADQPDFPTAVKFINALIKAGIEIEQATASFTVERKTYPAGSYVVKTDQAFRPHILDLFEPQDHPNDFQYEGGPPIAPYDAAGWTLAFQMGIQFDRVLNEFNGPFRKLPIGVLEKPPVGKLSGKGSGYLISHKINDGFILTNRLLKAGAEVYWLKDGVPGQANMGPGTLYIPAKGSAQGIIEKTVAQLGLNAQAVSKKPSGSLLKLAPVRVALWDRYGGSMPSGWTRWLFEQFEFPFDVIYPKTLDAGNLRSKYDVIVFVNGAIPNPNAASGNQRGGGNSPSPDRIPEEFHSMLGNITADHTIPQLKIFLESGGTVLTIGSSTSLAQYLGLPITNALTQKAEDGTEKPLTRNQYYVPGSILKAAVDSSHPLAWGMDNQASVFFDNSPVFRLGPDAAAKGIKPILWFDNAEPLQSGWAWGQKYLENGVTVAEAKVGEGKLFLMGPEINFRAQPHGTFKLLFNGLYLSTAQPENPADPSEK